jgi:hypothetical protein
VRKSWRIPVRSRRCRARRPCGCRPADRVDERRLPGHSQLTPFDGIIVTAAPSEIAHPLIDQLAVGAAHDPGKTEHAQRGDSMQRRNGTRTHGRYLLAAVCLSLSVQGVARAQTPTDLGELGLVPPVWLPADEQLFALASPAPEAADADEEKVGFTTFLLDSLVIHAAMWPLTLAFSSKVRNGILDSSWSDWKHNVSQWPNWNDDSDAITNWVSHPLLGATNFLVYRSRGHNLLWSSAGVVLQSFLLEYAIEGAFNRPSLHDLVITPLIGIPVGYGLDSLSVYLLKKEQKPLRYLGYVCNPFNILPTAKESRWQVTVDPVNKTFSFALRY